MLEAIKEIGDIILSDGEDELLKEMTMEIKKPKSKDAVQYIVIIDINTDMMLAKFEIEKLKDNSAKEYLWVGNASSSNSPQWRMTTDNLGYLISQAVPSLYERLSDSSMLKQKLKKIIENGIVSFSDDVGKRYRYVWDLDKMGIQPGFNCTKFEEEVSQKSNNKNKDKKLVEGVIKLVDEYIKGKFDLGKKDSISLYVLKIDGELVCHDKDYIKLINDEKVNDIFEGGNKGICSSCGREVNVIWDTKRFRNKYYNTDKINFSSNVTGDFSKNYNLCFDCYKDILVSEIYIQNNLASNIVNIPLYIIPGFIFDTEIDRKTLDKWAEYIKFNFNTASTFSNMEDFTKGLQNYLDYEDEDNNYILNLLFYRRNQQEFKILKLIKDVPPTRLKEMISATNTTLDMGKKLFSVSNAWKIDLNKIYYLIPQRKSGNDLLELSKLLEVYDCIFSKKPISVSFLIDKFVELASVYRYSKFALYNVSPSMQGNAQGGDRAIDSSLVYSMLQCNLMLRYLKKLGTLKGGNTMDVNELKLADHYKNYIKEMGYNEQQTAMFLLGCLVADVANAQYSAKLTSKPILDKITYQGINKDKLIRLTLEVFEKLKQYKVLSYDEGIMAQMKKLLDKNLSKWGLNDRENVFYILSGYSYNTYRVMSSAKKEINNGEENINEE